MRFTFYRKYALLGYKLSYYNFSVSPLSRNHAWSSLSDYLRSEISVGDRKLVLQSGRLARFADGCATASYGDTCVMATAISTGSSTHESGFAPLTVDYRQKAAAVGRIPTNFLRRELGVSPMEILTGRMIDRSLRPYFPVEYKTPTQVMCNLLAVDSENDPDVLSINAASAALALSDIPWDGPIGAVRVGYIKDAIVINPTRTQFKNSELNLIIAVTEGNKIAMIDGSANRLPHSIFKQCLIKGVHEAQSIVAAISKLQETHGKPKRPFEEQKQLDETLVEKIRDLAENRIREIYTDATHLKISRDQSIDAVRKDVLAAKQNVNPQLINKIFFALNKRIFRDLIFERNIRCDGRDLNALRNISCQTDLYKPLHGSALFQRGQTQVMATLAFDSPFTTMKVDPVSSAISGSKEKNFFLHYEFPPYATNETGHLSFGRRELGHGALAEKALVPVIPDKYPFTIRLTAEVLESNGSSSMASACAGSLALMDAGVPIREHVGGVAVGIVTRSTENGDITDYRILADLLGIEDYNGDMDMKVAGTADGITAIQADIKLRGLPLDIAIEALDVASEKKISVIEIMTATLGKPRQQPKHNHPVTEQISVPLEKMSRFLGVGGINLKQLRDECGVSIASVDSTTFSLFAPNQDAFNEAKERIDELLNQDDERQLDFGAIYQGTITELRDSGVMVQLYPNMRPALIPNKQLDSRMIMHPSALGLKVGDAIRVKYLGRDPITGAMRMSRKAIKQPAVTRVQDMMKNQKL